MNIFKKIKIKFIQGVNFINLLYFSRSQSCCNFTLEIYWSFFLLKRFKRFFQKCLLIKNFASDLSRKLQSILKTTEKKFQRPSDFPLPFHSVMLHAASNQLFLQSSRAGIDESMDVCRLVAINFHLLLWKAHAFGVAPCAFFWSPLDSSTHANPPKNGENFKNCGEIEQKSPPKNVFERIFHLFSRS